MRRQIMLFVALPNGKTSTTAKLSILVSPRLQTTETDKSLGTFPDFANWAGTVNSLTWQVKIGATTFTAAVTGTHPRSDVWTGLFPSDVPVRSFVYRGLHDRTINSYPAGNIDDFLTSRFSKIANESSDGHPAVSALLNNTVLGKIAWKPPRLGQIGGRQAALNRLATKYENGVVPPGASDPAVDFVQADNFLRPRMPIPPGTPPPPPAAPDNDFHQAISLLSKHPQLMRYLGLVVDLEFPTSMIPAGATLQISVKPLNWTPLLDTSGGETIKVSPQTTTSAALFRPKPQAAGSEVTDMFLNLGDGTARLTAVDLLHATNRLLRFGGMLRRLQEPEHDRDPQAENESLPSLTQNGLVLYRTGRAGTARTRFGRQRDIDDLIATAIVSTPPGTFQVTADDLEAGYRFDLFDDTSGAWRQLCARTALHGTYTIFPKGGGTLTVPAANDEGSVGTTPGTDGTEDGELFLSEILARWNGWSLVAPHPGQIVDGATGEAIPPPSNMPTEDSVVQLAVDYRAAPGTLPRLRFGRKYRMRARIVDPAGNSRPVADASPAGTETPDVVYGRFDPVSSPTVMRRTVRNVPHDATDRLVIRSNYNVPNTSPAIVAAQRHIAPPSVAQWLVEQHGEPAGGVSPGAYQDLMDRDGAALEDVATLDPDTGEYHFDGANLPIPYLPDPRARGATILGAPGKTGPTTALFATTASVYPDSTPFRLVVKAGTGPPMFVTSPSPQLTIFLPKARVAKIKLSCNLASGDEDEFALWHRLTPAMQNKLRTKIIGGRHWMFTPFRELTLMHAVKQPLLKPSFPTLEATRPRKGALHAHVSGTLHLNRPSTERVTLSATWTDLVDDLTQPGPVDVVHDAKLEAVSIPTEGGATDEPIPDRRLEIGDTKHHEVDVTGEAISRFTRFFEKEVAGVLNGTTEQTFSALPVVAETVVVTNEDGSVGYRRERKGVGDYTLVVGPQAKIARTAGSTIPDGGSVKVLFVQDPVSRLSTEGGLDPARVTVPSSARPTPPDVRYVLPIWERTVTGTTVTRSARAVRVYLGRPWNVSGNGELLGVVIPTVQDNPTDEFSTFATQFGRDPLWNTGAVDQYPDTADFPFAVATSDELTMAEAGSQTVFVLGHAVEFDADRGLWFSDIRVLTQKSYMPFVRLGVVRYQPDSMAGLEVSPPVVIDPVQMLPDRTVTVTGSGLSRHVTVTGISYTQFDTGPGRNPTVYCAVQQVNAGIPDPDLRWEMAPAQPSGGRGKKLTRTAPASATADTTWAGDVTIPGSGGPFRLLVREFELHQEGGADPPFTTKERIVFLETVEI
jgi:hypothetical protein